MINRISDKKKNLNKIIGAGIFGVLMLTSTLVGTISLQPSFAQSNASKTSDVQQMKEDLSSLLQSSTEGSGIVSDSPTFDVVEGKKIETIPNSFIVQLKEQADVSSMGDAISALTLDVESVGGNITNVYDQLGMFNIQFDKEQTVSGLSNESSLEISAEAEDFVNTLKQNPAVEAVYNDGIVTIQAQVLPNDQNRVDADLSPTKSGDGAGMVNADIAIIDTGVQSDHPDLNVFKCVSFVDNPTPGVPRDLCTDGQGHGTHVAGTAAAKDDGNGVVGKAPGARIWAIKVLSDSGSGTFSDILEGINYVAANSNSIEVINMSLGGGGTFPPLETAITNLVNSKGVVVVVAAGNENSDANNFTPARTPAAITVSAAADSNGKCGGGGPATSRGLDDSYADFSNHGSVVDIAAEGTDVFSTYKGSKYATMSGTSMAAPNVAGAAALYKSMNPSATPVEVDAYLKSTGTKMATSGSPLLPCDGNGKGYFDPANDGDTIREPLLYMGWSAPMCKEGPLTGVWNNNDGGKYYIKQCDNTVWWAGLSNNGTGTKFTNVFKGKISPLPPGGIIGKNIVGDWCDVPRGTIMNCGLLTVKINSMDELKKVFFTGGFSGSLWTR
jgi:subtilisin family serine protease